MLANPPWRQLGAPEDSGRPEARLRIEEIFSCTKCIAQFNTAQNAFQGELGLVRPMFKTGRFRGWGVVAFCPNEKGGTQA
jgi:hypothetical protein